jgi:hypothetical protein
MQFIYSVKAKNASSPKGLEAEENFLGSWIVVIGTR